MNRINLSIACLLLCGCGSPDTSLFPLDKGYWWQYSAIRYIKGEAHEQKLVIANLPAVTVDGLRLHRKKRADGRVDYFQKTDTGISRIDIEDGSETLLLKQPYEVGTKWQSDSRILFLEVTGAFQATYNRRIEEKIVIEYEIQSVDDTVEVAAGKFRNCIRVNGFGSIYGGGGSLKEYMAIDTINIETVDWYAPGIGLVKRTRKEYTYPLEFENNYSEELEKIKTG